VNGLVIGQLLGRRVVVRENVVGIEVVVVHRPGISRIAELGAAIRGEASWRLWGAEPPISIRAS
jgi:hypothetical protein